MQHELIVGWTGYFKPGREQVLYRKQIAHIESLPEPGGLDGTPFVHGSFEDGNSGLVFEHCGSWVVRADSYMNGTAYKWGYGVSVDERGE